MKAIKGFRFPYGTHVPDNKHLSSHCAIEKMPAVDMVHIALSQHIGKPAAATVAVGDSVKMGQLIAKADGMISSNVFSSVSGTVTKIEEHSNELGGAESYIIIENDKNDTEEFLTPLTNPSADEIKQRILDAGIVGLGGAGFPTFVKMNPPTQVDTLILNGAECEPYLTCDHRDMLENCDAIANGARYIAKALGVSKILIGIEANKMDCIAVFEKYDDIQPVILKKQYPMGSEKHLIYVCNKRKVPTGKLPSDVGCVVENVATCKAVCEAVELGKPLFERTLTISGRAINEPKNLCVRVGTCFEDLVTACGGTKDDLTKIVRGGPMTGASLVGSNGYTRKATGGVLYLDSTEASADEPSPCLNCGKCADICPMRLMPMQIALYSSAGDYASAEKLGGATNCIECGSCVFVCPANRPLIQCIRKTKAELRKIRR